LNTNVKGVYTPKNYKGIIMAKITKPVARECRDNQLGLMERLFALMGFPIGLIKLLDCH
jgi:hypothetical protein